MADKVWNKGTNAVFAIDFEGFPKGTKCWIYDTSDQNNLVVLTKTDKDVPRDQALKEVKVPMDRASGVISCTVGKPRKDFDSIRLTKEDVEKMILEKAKAAAAAKNAAAAPAPTPASES